MIEPTAEDIGRRVRWIGSNFGVLQDFDGPTGLVLFDYEKLPMRIELNNLFWADNNLGRMITGDREPSRHPRKAFRNNPPGLWRDRKDED